MYELGDQLPYLAFAFGGWIGAAIGAAGSLLGGVLANKSREEQAEKQMAFQREMRQSAYQDAVKDMRKAGLNPMLAYQQGGAAVPAGAMASVDDVVTPAVSSALSAKRLREDIENIRADTSQKEQQEKLLKAQQQKTAVDTVTAFEQNKIAAAEADLKQLEADRSRKYGESILGRNLQSFERMLSRFMGWSAKSAE